MREEMRADDFVDGGGFGTREFVVLSGVALDDVQVPDQKSTLERGEMSDRLGPTPSILLTHRRTGTAAAASPPKKQKYTP
jgi:hypothetical protein